MFLRTSLETVSNSSYLGNEIEHTSNGPKSSWQIEFTESWIRAIASCKVCSSCTEAPELHFKASKRAASPLTSWLKSKCDKSFAVAGLNAVQSFSIASPECSCQEELKVSNFEFKAEPNFAINPPEAFIALARAQIDLPMAWYVWKAASSKSDDCARSKMSRR